MKTDYAREYKPEASAVPSLFLPSPSKINVVISMNNFMASLFVSVYCQLNESLITECLTDVNVASNGGISDPQASEIAVRKRQAVFNGLPTFGCSPQIYLHSDPLGPVLCVHIAEE